MAALQIRTARGRLAGLVLLAGALLITVVASIAVGVQPIAPDRAIAGLLRPDGSEQALIVRDLRLPRTLLGVAVGAALGIAGALMQALTRNPLAAPGLLGINGGAAFAVVLVIWTFRADEVLVYVWAALAGAAATALLVYLIGAYGSYGVLGRHGAPGSAAGGAGATPERLVLAGVALNALFAALTTGVMLLDPRAFNSFRFWQVGSLAGRELSLLPRIAPFLLVGAVLAFCLGGSLNALALGEDAGRSLGARPGQVRALGALAIVLLCGAATAAVGPIVFLGLAVPFVVRALIGQDQRWVLAHSTLLAPVVLLAADIGGRVLGAPGELETGLVTAFLGAPIFIAMVRRMRIPRL
jgi:iron complex transport system permease protein